jgi:cell division cycle 14
MEPDSVDIADPTLCHFSVDDWFAYPHLRNYHGPSNIAHILQFISTVNALHEKEGKMVCVCTDRSKAQKSNCVLLVGAYLVLEAGMGWKQAGKVLKPLAQHVVKFVTEGRNHGDTYGTIGVLQCLKALERFSALNILDKRQIDIKEYYKRESPFHGDLTWIVPRQLVAMAGPTPGVYDLEEYGEYCKANNIGVVVRLNKTSYSPRELEQLGNLKHIDLLMADGGTPTDAQVTQFINLCIETIDTQHKAIAVHCRAGLGRTGTMIACWLMWKHKVTATETVAFLRTMRPGSLLEDQPAFLHKLQPRLHAGWFQTTV